MAPIPTIAFVLAAGLGTRMRPLTDRLPKPLVPLAGRALLDHVLDRIAAAGIAEAVVNVHYMADQIEAHLAARGARGAGPRIRISDERALLLDTGGGAVNALPLLGDAPFLIHNSDTVWLEPGDTPRPLIEEITNRGGPGRVSRPAERETGLARAATLAPRPGTSVEHDAALQHQRPLTPEQDRSPLPVEGRGEERPASARTSAPLSLEASQSGRASRPATELMTASELKASSARDPSNLARLVCAFDTARMDALLLLAKRETSLGYSGRGDFTLGADGRIARPPSDATALRATVPYVFAGVSMTAPRLLRDTRAEPFSLNRVWDRALAEGRLFGLELDGTWMHVGDPAALAAAERLIADASAS